MAEHGSRHGGDQEIDEEGQELTVDRTEAVAVSESFCGGRNRRNPAAVPAMKTTKLASAALLLGFN